ncbi:immunoglobulin domain-containing protein [Streptomyces bicolor]|uniref:immunoglobulin domain-containing protein n=1 Tax=Streptomyces bicolor TaxID=66874 RepID=UPI0004E1135F|nr:immunoglobulin domain-containing protein [Streptomyces bicolor]
MTDEPRPTAGAGRRFRRPAALLGAAALVAAAVTLGSTAQASDTPKTALGKDGQKLTVTASANLDPDGETLRVTGSGYDATKAIYVALCKDNGDNRVPTPCLGGADQNGSGSSSQWIVPEGDEYAGDLAVTWGVGGTFDVEIGIKAKDGGLDCTKVTCSVVTRVDHRNPGDRSQDVRIPVTFEGQDPGDGGGGDGVDVPPGTVSYVRAAEFTTAGRPLDLLLHPDSGKLYVGSDNIPDTADIAEQGLYAIDPKDGTLLGHIQQAPGATGALAARVVRWIAGPLAGDGVVFHYPLRGIGTAKDGDTAAKGVWLAGGTVTATVELPEASVYFVETDPATGNVWVGSSYDVLVFDKDGKQLAKLTGKDRATAMAFDKATGEAFVLREDWGTADDGADNVGALEIYDSATARQAAEPVALPGNRAGAYAGVAVTPGASSVYVTSQAESKVVKLDRRVSPKIVQSPTDQSVAPGGKVTFVAAAEGAPEPTVRWQVSPDEGQIWSAIEGATQNAYTFTAKAAQDGYRYRAEFTNAAGTTRTSPITLTVTEPGDGGDNGGGDDGGDGDGSTEPSGSKTVTGPNGQKLTVTPVNDLATEDQTLKVTGTGYDTKKGIYVALCVDNGDGELPTPCIGGVDMTGGSHSSAWISSNPPDYGADLAIPYGDGGTFEVELTVAAKDEYTDCFKATCVLATRNDHTLSGDRSQDVKVPVSFVGQDPVDTDDDTGGTGGTGGNGGTGTTGGSTGGSDTGSTTGGSGGTGTSTAGGSLASTGVTVLSVAALAAALLATGWVVYRKGRTVN